MTVFQAPRIPSFRMTFMTQIIGLRKKFATLRQVLPIPSAASFTSPISQSLASRVLVTIASQISAALAPSQVQNSFHLVVIQATAVLKASPTEVQKVFHSWTFVFHQSVKN